MVWGPNSVPAVSGEYDAVHESQFRNPLPTGQPPIPTTYIYPSGDSSGTLDWLNIQTALNAAQNQGAGVSGGSMVGLAPGLYWINQPLVIYARTWLAGLAGRGAVLIRAAPAMSVSTGLAFAAGGMLVNDKQRAGFGGSYDTFIHISDITWDQNGSVQTAANGNALRFVGTADLIIERCQFINPKSSLLLIADAAANLNSHVRPIVQDCLFDGTGNVTADLIDFGNLSDGKFLRNTVQNCSQGNAFSTAFSVGLLIEGCVIKGNATQGLSLQPMNDCKVVDCHIVGNGTWGIQASVNPLTSGGNLQNILDLMISGCSIHGNTGSGILLQTASSVGNASYGVNGNTPQRVKIVNNDIYANGHAGIECQWMDTVIIADNIFYANSTVGAGTWAAIHCVTLGTPGSQVNTNVLVENNSFYDDTTPTQTVIANLTQASAWTFIGNHVRNNTTFVALGSGNAAAPFIAVKNRGYNPVTQSTGAILNTTVASVCSPVMIAGGQPTSGTVYTNISGVDWMLYISSASGISARTLDGITLAAPTAIESMLVPAGSTFSFTWATTQPVTAPYGL